MRYNRSVSNIAFILKVSRPRFWIYIFGPYLLGIAASVSGAAEFTSIRTLIFGFYFLFPANLLVYGVNDIFDFETDRLNPKKSDYEALVSPDYRIKLAIAIAFFNLPFLLVAFLYFPNTLLAMAGFLFFAIGYSAPPIRAKTKPFLDSLFNVLYVFPGIFAFVLFTGLLPPIEAIAAAGFWTMAMHAYSAIPDIDSDTKAGIQTIATKLDISGTLAFCLVCYAISATLAYRYLGPFTLVYIAYLLMIGASYHLRESESLFRIYRFFPILNTIIGFILFWFIAYPKFG